MTDSIDKRLWQKAQTKAGQQIGRDFENVYEHLRNEKAFMPAATEFTDSSGNRLDLYALLQVFRTRRRDHIAEKIHSKLIDEVVKKLDKIEV